MKTLLSIAAIIAVCLSGAVGKTAELPSYELMGFPITQHQFSVLGSANIKERSSSPSHTMNGMPASPHQLSVIRE